MYQFILFLLVITILFIIYSEYTVGGILIRTDSSGKDSINISSMFNFMIHPLKNKLLWNYKSLDINYPFIIIISTILYKFDFIINYFL
uniref:Uncharacterized protein n=1 Tax=viral metagenome TaxID=1070528 RepID=A0A6C0C5D0_9ZZZZ